VISIDQFERPKIIRNIPSIFFQEYEEFTSKLHDFSGKEQQLKEKLRLQSIDSSFMDPEDSIASVFTTSSPTTTVAPLSVTMDSFDLPTEPVPNSPLLQPISSDSNNGLTDPDMVSLESPPPAGVGSGYEFGALIDQHSSSSSQISSAIVPKSPVKTIVRAHLGDHGHTFVSTKPGITVREALSKAMKLRKLTPETCAVYNCSDPTKVTTIFFKSCDFFLLLNS
jgi:hypothetical protein